MALGLSACSGGDLGPGPEPPAAAAITIEGGSGQSGPVGEALDAPILARVTDAQGREVSGVTVTFAAAQGSGSLAPASAVTDEAGEARAVWTLGTRAGPMSANAAVSGLAPAAATATALAGAPVRLGFRTVPTAAVAGIAFDPPVAVAIEDGHGNLVPGTSAVIALTLNQGPLGGQTAVQAVDGLARFPGLHIDVAGHGYVLTATADGLAGAESVSFPVASGIASRLEAVNGDGQQATAGSAVATAPSVVVRDASGNGVSGVNVVFTVTGGGGTVAPGTVVTGADGMASITTWTLGTVAGTNTLRADAAALPGVSVEFVAQGAAGPVDPSTSTLSAAPASLLTGETSAVTVTARDAWGNPVAGAAVELSATGGGNTIVQPPATGEDGTTSGTFSSSDAGASTISAVVAGVTLEQQAEVSVSLNGGTLTDVTYCTMDGVADTMDVYIPDASKPRPLPVAVHVHGGGWTGGSKSSGSRFAELMPLLLGRGYLVVSLDYRLAPTHKYPAQIQDVKCAIRHLRARAWRYGLDPARIGAWGGSAGGQLVALLGTADASAGFDDVGGFQNESSAVQAVVAISAITDFTHPEELRDDYSRVFQTWPDPTSPEMIEASPVTHVSAGDAPFFLIAGEDDDLVLPAQSGRLHQRLQEAGVPSALLTVRNADHDLQPTDGPTEPSGAVINSRLADFFDQHLR